MATDGYLKFIDSLMEQPHEILFRFIIFSGHQLCALALCATVSTRPCCG